MPFVFLNSVCDKESNDMWNVLIWLYLHRNRLSDLSMIEFENRLSTATKSMYRFERLSPRQIAWKVQATHNRQSLKPVHTFPKYVQVCATSLKVWTTRRFSDKVCTQHKAGRTLLYVLNFEAKSGCTNFRTEKKTVIFQIWKAGNTRPGEMILSRIPTLFCTYSIKHFLLEFGELSWLQPHSVSN